MGSGMSGSVGGRSAVRQWRPGRDQAGALNLVSNTMNAMADAPGRHPSARNFLELGTFEEFSSANLPVASNVVTE